MGSTVKRPFIIIKFDIFSNIFLTIYTLLIFVGAILVMLFGTSQGVSFQDEKRRCGIIFALSYYHE